MAVPEPETQPLTEPTTEAGRDALAALLADPAAALLASDFDGVLAPIVDDPDRAYVHPGAVAVLGRLAGRLGGVAVVTGRPVAQVLELGGFAGADGLSGLRILGQYGVERWDARSGETIAPPPPPGVDDARRRLPGLLADLDLADARVEDKGRALVVHLRGNADPEAAMERLREPLQAMADELDLHVEPGKHVLELRAPGSDKGEAIDLLLADSGAATVAYAGDDLGDGAAYDAVEHHRAGTGHGLLIWSASAEGPGLSDRADVVVDGPDGVIGWLSALADRLEGSR